MRLHRDERAEQHPRRACGERGDVADEQRNRGADGDDNAKAGGMAADLGRARLGASHGG